MEILEEIKNILAELLDLGGKEILPATYLFRDLGVESIDLLELALAISSRFHIEVKDDEIFLQDFRIHLLEAQQKGEPSNSYLLAMYPFLTEERVTEMIADHDAGPTLQVQDLISYIIYQTEGRKR